LSENSLQDKLNSFNKEGQDKNGSGQTIPYAKAEKIPVLELEPFIHAGPVNTEEKEKENGWSGWLTFFLISFGGGIAALLTPCIFPMIPMTVSYFTKSGGKRANGLSNAFIFGLSIIVVYTLIGTVFSLLFGADF